MSDCCCDYRNCSKDCVPRWLQLEREVLELRETLRKISAYHRDKATRWRQDEQLRDEWAWTRADIAAYHELWANEAEDALKKT